MWTSGDLWAVCKHSDLCPSRETDLVLLGDCDKTVTRLADTIGWREDLEAVTVTSLEDALT